jgi:DNA-binding NtrC family response regulator
MSSPARATVLVLEASPAVQELVDQGLREAGHRVLSTGWPGEAREVVRRVRVDVLVAGMVNGGVEALVDELRAIQPDLRLVSIRGANGAAPAPVSLEALVEAVAANVET